MSEKPTPSKLSPAEVERRMREHPEWRVEEDKIRRRFDFDDFVGAFGFITRVALVAEAMQHHPEWSNVYGTVTIELSTHDVGGLSDKDFSLASAIDRLAAQG